MTGMKSLMRFKRGVMKLRRCIQLSKPIRRVTSDYETLESSLAGCALVPKGHFAVLAGDGDGERFVVELRYLKSPGLVRLLEEAEEEYGFQQEGSLVVPCKPEELHKILGGMI